MRLQNRLLLLLTLFISHGFAQTDVILPHKEHRPYFNLSNYPEGLSIDSMQGVYNQLENQQKISWKHKDSLDFLFALIAIGEFDEAINMYRSTRKLVPRNLEELHLAQYLFEYKRYYSDLKIWLDYEVSNYPDHNKHVHYRRRIHDVEKLMLAKNWNTDDSLIFPELSPKLWKGVQKGSQEYLDNLIPLIKTIDSALRIETKYEFSSSVALARAFYEFGNFLEKQVSLTDAFVALAIARYYDKFNVEINEKFRSIRTKMNDRGYVFPSMRQLFPKQSKGYFNIESIKKRRLSKLDTASLRQMNPEALKKKEVKNTQILDDVSAFLIMFIGSIVLLFYVIFFVKVKS